MTDIAMKLELPNWIQQSEIDKTTFIIDGDKAYPWFFEKLTSHTGKDIPRDEYWLEIALQCIKLHSQFFVKVTGLDPRPKDRLKLIIEHPSGLAGKELWCQKGKEKGRGWHAATKGFEAKNTYKAIFGILPE